MEKFNVTFKFPPFVFCLKFLKPFPNKERPKTIKIRLSPSLIFIIFHLACIILSKYMLFRLHELNYRRFFNVKNIYVKTFTFCRENWKILIFLRKIKMYAAMNFYLLFIQFIIRNSLKKFCI